MLVIAVVAFCAVLAILRTCPRCIVAFAQFWNVEIDGYRYSFNWTAVAATAAVFTSVIALFIARRNELRELESERKREFRDRESERKQREVELLVECHEMCYSIRADFALYATRMVRLKQSILGETEKENHLAIEKDLRDDMERQLRKKFSRLRSRGLILQSLARGSREGVEVGARVFNIGIIGPPTLISMLDGFPKGSVCDTAYADRVYYPDFEMGVEPWESMGVSLVTEHDQVIQGFFMHVTHGIEGRIQQIHRPNELRKSSMEEAIEKSAFRQDDDTNRF